MNKAVSYVIHTRRLYKTRSKRGQQISMLCVNSGSTEAVRSDVTQKATAQRLACSGLHGGSGKRSDRRSDVTRAL